MKARRSSGYSENLAKLYVPIDITIYSLSEELNTQVKWIDGKPTNDVTGYQCWFIAKGTEPFKVKFPTQIALPPMLSKVKLQNLEACEVGRNVYFRAKAIEVIK